MNTGSSSTYSLRDATIDDIDAIVHHRLSMFLEMGIALDAHRLQATFASWLNSTIPAGVYRGWLVETEAREIAAGGGITVLPWPPGPREFSGSLPLVYNMYTEPLHRHRGLARLVMEAAHTWCRDAGFRLVGLAASDAGRPLYEALGYKVSRQPYMFKSL
ncbi:MAG: GNAT family N-acetyltransferase [Acidobacteria bacterium]|nr:GNAT family N-acetyltransferase [Acidobacteriota bacterium]